MAKAPIELEKAGTLSILTCASTTLSEPLSALSSAVSSFHTVRAAVSRSGMSSSSCAAVPGDAMRERHKHLE